MISNYFKIAWRSIWKHKAYSIINIVGLSIGLTACLIVATVVFDELSYDHQWTKRDNIYRILSASKGVKGKTLQSVSIASLGPTLKKDFPEVADYCRMNVQKDQFKLGTEKQGVPIKYLDAEASVWNFLDFDILKGDPKKVVKGYKNLIITEKLARQYFKTTDPVGKVISSIPQFGKPQDYLITGVIANIPRNTHLWADAIIIADFPPSYDIMPAKMGGTTFLTQYILLKPGTSVNAFTNKINKAYARLTDAMASDYTHQFQSIKDVYLKSDFGDSEAYGSIRTVYIFAGVAALLLIIACINFINLTISRVFNRAKETGIRKVLGAEKLQLIIRFLAESLLFFIIAFTVAIILYPLFIKPVETYLGHQLVLNIYNISFLLLTVGCVFLVSLLTGLYPAWFLSRPKPVVILRNNISGGVQLNLLKKCLVVGQFVISITIIMVTLVVHNQLDYISKKDLGFDKNNLLNIGFSDWGTKGADFKQSIKRLPGVENASLSQWWPTMGARTSSTEMELPGQKEKITINYIYGDIDLASTLKLKLKNGRVFNSNLATDMVDGDSIYSSDKKTREIIWNRPVLVTNYTAALLSLKINKKFTKSGGIPVGIIEDFNSQSLHDKLTPTFIEAHSNITAGNLLIRIKPGAEKAVLTAIDKLYKSYYPDNVLKYDWIDDLIDQQYQAEHKLQQLFTCFSALIVFLACLGLFGLVSFSTAQRLKEISIRKVLGAGVNNILILISKDYLLLVIIAIIIASPIAWYFMQQWLQDFAYRIDVDWWVFALTAFATLLIAFITISFQSLKAALSNPVKSLRND
jgi:putative ABC transport system permease protein